MEKHQSSKVKLYFDKNSKEWNDLYSENDLGSLILKQRKKLVIDYIKSLNLPDDSKILDIGCGAGLFIKELATNNYQLTGIDISEDMIKNAILNCQNFKNVKFICANIENYKIVDEEFDVIIMSGLIEYFPWDRWIIQKYSHYLKNNGFIIITVPNFFRISFLTNPLWLSKCFKIFILKFFGKFLNAKFGINIFTDYMQKKVMADYSKGFLRNLYNIFTFPNVLNQIQLNTNSVITNGFGPIIFLKKLEGLSLFINKTFENMFLGKSTFLSKIGSNSIFFCQKKVQQPTEKEFTKFKKKNRKMYKELTDFIIKNNITNDKLNQNNFIDPNKNILVISPHPDDEIIGCGGTLCNLNPSKITILNLTDGRNAIVLKNSSEKEKSETRNNEFIEVMEKMLIKDYTNWNENADEFNSKTMLKNKLVDLLKLKKYEIIFIPFINDPHIDHKTSNYLLAAALEEIDNEKIEIFSYEVWSLVPTNVTIDITKNLNKKNDLLRLYETGMKAFDYIYYCKMKDTDFTYNNNKCYEKFYRLNRNNYIKLIEKIKN